MDSKWSMVVNIVAVLKFIRCHFDVITILFFPRHGSIVKIGLTSNAEIIQSCAGNQSHRPSCDQLCSVNMAELA